MAVDVVGVALDFIAEYGLVAIFVLLVLDAAMMMPVFPGEVVLVMAVAAYADDYAGLAFLVGLTTLAALLGSLLLYGIMRGGGRKLVERYPRLFMMPRKRREKLERSFARPAGQSLVLFLRLVPLTRVLVNIPAGLAKMKLPRFVLLTTAGLLVYHAAFLWFAFEVRRPGSTLDSQRQQLQDAYGSPAMEFVSANAILAGLVLLAIGTVASVRASRAILRDPEESTGSLLGWLATMVFLWGGLALAAAAYLDPDPVVALAGLGGVDVDALASWLGLSILQVLWAAAALMLLVGAILRGMTTYAHGHRRRHLREQKAQKDPDYRRKALRDPFRERGPDDGMPEDLVAFEAPPAAPALGLRPTGPAAGPPSRTPPGGSAVGTRVRPTPARPRGDASAEDPHLR